MPSTAFILLAIVFVLGLAVLSLSYMSENGGSFWSLIRQSKTSFFLVISVFGVLGVALWIFGFLGGVVVLVWFVNGAFRIGSSSSRRRNFWANDQSSLSNDNDHSWMNNGPLFHGPACNIDGTPMANSMVDVKGNPYGVTDMFSSSSSDMFSSSSSSSDMFSSSSSSHSFD